jgi:hypothetical protein
VVVVIQPALAHFGFGDDDAVVRQGGCVHGTALPGIAVEIAAACQAAGGPELHLAAVHPRGTSSLGMSLKWLARRTDRINNLFHRSAKDRMLAAPPIPPAVSPEPRLPTRPSASLGIISRRFRPTASPIDTIAVVLAESSKLNGDFVFAESLRAL